MHNSLHSEITDTYRGKKNGSTRYRHIRHRKLDGVDPLDYDNLPAQEGMRKKFRRTFTSNHKHLNYQKLDRWLEGRVGRRWDDVYSELCAGLDRRRPMDDLAIKHVKKTVLRPYRHNQRVHADFHKKYTGFFVDQKGILRENKPKKYTRSERYKAYKVVQLPDGSMAVPYQGEWCRIRYARLQRPYNIGHYLAPVVKAVGYEIKENQYAGAVVSRKLISIGPDGGPEDHIDYIKELTPLTPDEVSTAGLPKI